MRSQTLVIPFLAALAGGCTLDFDEPIGQQQQEIVNGQVNSGDPAVGLVVMDQIGSCTGTLISSKVILTARHCVLLEDGSEVPAGDIGVFWGTQPAQGDTPILVSSYQYHPSADIAVLELVSPGTAAPIPMNTTALDSHLGIPVRVAGYGVTAENNRDSGTKRVGTSALFGLDPQTELGNVMLIGQTGSKTCYGDSGGPAFITLDGLETVAGVTSFGTGPCEEADTLDGQIRVDIYHSWILEFINRVDPNGLPESNVGPGDPSDPSEPSDPSDPSDPDSTGQGGPPADIVGGCSTGGTGGGASAALLLAVIFGLRRRSSAR